MSSGMKMTNQLKLVNDLVLLREDGVKCGSWLLRRTEQAHPGQDSTVRVVDVLTKTGVYVRPVVKVYSLKECYVDKVPQSVENVTESTSDRSN